MTANKTNPKAKGVSRASKSAARSKPKADPKHTVEKSADWRAKTLDQIRRMIHEADPDIVEERKWVKPTNPSGVPVWSHAGIVCTGEMYKQVVKLTFFRGASLDDPHGLFNSGLEGGTRRAIDIREDEAINGKAFKTLIQAAVTENLRMSGPKSKSPKSVAKKQSTAMTAEPLNASKDKKVVLLSGGNPQIAKADGDAPVQAYIAAMPGWKSAVGKRLDALIVRNAPQVRKAVKWNSPFYGIDGQGWFVTFHVFARYIKVTFFSGASLQPILPGGTPKSKEARWIDIYEDVGLNEEQMASWIKQAAKLPGWIP